MRPDFKPIILATPEVIQDAVANEKVLSDKALHIRDGELMELKEMITRDEWDKMSKRVEKTLKLHATPGDNINTTQHHISQDVMTRQILGIISQSGGECSLSWQVLRDCDQALHDTLRKQNKRLVNEIMKEGLIAKSGKRGMWVITEAGEKLLQSPN